MTDSIEDLRTEFLQRKKRKHYRCIDAMCGAEDCTNCHPEIKAQTTDDE